MIDRPSSWLLSAALSASALASAACATGDDCERRVAACLERCEAATDDREVARRSLPPQSTMTECELRCSCPRTSTTPKPQGPPTPTGN
jgi:hypothetical protein